MCLIDGVCTGGLAEAEGGSVCSGEGTCGGAEDI
jgi:hypothetical protein